MSDYNGFDGAVTDEDAGTDFGGIQSWSADITGEQVTKTSMGTAWAATQVTTKSASGSIEFNARLGDPHENLAVGDKLNVSLYPGDKATSGTAYLSGLIVITDVSRSAEKGGESTISVNWANADNTGLALQTVTP